MAADYTDIWDAEVDAHDENLARDNLRRNSPWNHVCNHDPHVYLCRDCRGCYVCLHTPSLTPPSWRCPNGMIKPALPDYPTREGA